MKTYIALFRGINVGGKNVLPMAELVALLESVGSHGVRTYIQSGNAVFRNEKGDASLLADRIGTAIEESRGFKPRVVLLGSEEMEKAIESNPFPGALSEPRTLHLYFPASKPMNPNFDALENARNDRERFAFEDGVFYLHAPDGIGRSRLAANLDRLLGVQMTGRNWRTVCKVMEMARQRGR